MTEHLDETAEREPEIGPIDYVVMEFVGDKLTGEAFPLLLDLVDRGLIRIIDLVFVRKDESGTTTVLKLDDVDGDGQLDLTIFEGASSHLMTAEDVDEAGRVLEPATSGAILVYENLWAAPLAGALRRAGGQLVASGRIPLEAVLEALDAADAAA